MNLIGFQRKLFWHNREIILEFAPKNGEISRKIKFMTLVSHQGFSRTISEYKSISLFKGRENDIVRKDACIPAQS
jgi:hypothetical protein